MASYALGIIKIHFNNQDGLRDILHQHAKFCGDW